MFQYIPGGHDVEGPNQVPERAHGKGMGPQWLGGKQGKAKAEWRECRQRCMENGFLSVWDTAVTKTPVRRIWQRDHLLNQSSHK